MRFVTEWRDLRHRGWSLSLAVLTQRVGRRGAALLFFCLLDLVFAYSLFAPPPEAIHNPSFAFVTIIAPRWFWGSLWLVAGLICGYNAFRASDKVGFSAAITIKVLWGTLYIFAMLHGVPRAYVSVTVWLCLAAWVAIISSWPEPPSSSAGGHRGMPIDRGRGADW